ncbi:uncharacterized protein LOC21391424 [Morus notabilis]|uniref:uncharacterized protein LOC21391424 n=1 Tax=Morus notabilis TaxID=981085 RepID=UPI000CED675B|nr:uncharacterized protein LOC21391424 [Morus notabilis]
MGSDTRPSRRVKDDENSNSKGKRSGDRGLSAASISAATSDSSGLRRSSRETLTKKVTAQTSPSVSVRKSERLEKKSPKTPSERVEKKCTPSPLLKKCDQNSGSSPKKQKKRKMEKSVKELTSETEEVGRSERRDSELKRNRLDGRSYKAMFFKKQLNKVKASDDSEKHARENMFSQGDSNNCRGDGINKCVERRLGELGDDGGTTENADDELEIIPENCSEVEKAKEPELVDSPFSGRITDGRGLKSDHDVIPTNRKRIRLDDADFEYSKLRCLKRLFLYRTGKLKVADSPRAPILSLSDSPEDYMNGIHSPSSMSGLALGTKLEQNDISRSIKTIQKKFHKKLNKLTQKQREEKNELVRSFEADKARIEEKKKMQIVVIRSCLENNTSMRVDKLKSVEISFAKEFEELEQQMDTRLKKLELEHLAARRKIQDRETQCIDAVKSLVALDELSGNRPSSEPNDNTGDVTLRFPQTNSSNDGANNIAHENVNPPSSEEQICNGLTVNVLEKEIQLRVPEMIGCSEVPLVVSETIGSGDGLENLVSGDGPSSEEQIPNTTAVNVPVNEMQPRVPESVGLGDGDTIGSVTQMSLAEQNQDTVNVLEEVQLRVPETIGCSELAEQNQDTVNMTEKEVQLRVPEAIGCSEIQLRVPEAIGCSEIQLRVPEAIGCSEVQLGVPAMIGSGDGQQNLVSEDGHLSEDQIPATTAVNVPINQMQPRVPKNVSSGDGDTIGSVIEPSLAEQNQDKVNVSKKEVQLRVPETIGCSEVPLGVLETIGSGDSLENLVSGDGTLSEEQIPFTTAVSDPINKMQPRVPENVSSGDGDSVGSVTQMSLAEQIPDTATLNVPGGENTLVPEASCDAVEVSQTSIENNETQTVASNKITGMNQQDIVDNAFDQNSPLQELSLGNLPSVHPAIAMIYGDLMSANQACKDEYTLPSISCGMQLGDVPPRDEQNATEVMQLSLGNSPSVHPAIAMIDGDPMSVNQARGDECTLPSISCAMQLGDVPPCDEQNATAVVCSVSQTVEPALSYQSDHEAMVSEPAVQVHLSPPSNSPRSFNAAAVPFVGEVANLPSSEGCTFNPATELVMNPPLVLNPPMPCF